MGADGGRLRRQLADVEEMLNQRVVAGDSLRAAAADDIAATVADMADVDLVAEQGGRGGRGPHAVQARRSTGVGMNLAVGDLHRLQQTLPQVPGRRPAAVAPRLRHVGVDGVRRHRAGHLARLRAAHAVGDDEQGARGRDAMLQTRRADAAAGARHVHDEEIILVVPTDLADVAGGHRLEGQRRRGPDGPRDAVGQPPTRPEHATEEAEDPRRYRRDPAREAQGRFPRTSAISARTPGGASGLHVDRVPSRAASRRSSSPTRSRSSLAKWVKAR